MKTNKNNEKNENNLNESSEDLSFESISSIRKSIDSNQIKTMIQCLEKNDLENIIDIEKKLYNYNDYMKLFEKDFEEKKEKAYLNFLLSLL